MPTFWENYDQVVEQLLILCIISAVQYYAESHYNKIPCRISNLSGEEYVESIIHQHHPGPIQEVFRMPLYTFLQLDIWLQENTFLKPSRYISVAEKLTMFLSSVGYAITNRGVQERFQHSGETVSRCFHEVLQALVLMHVQYVQIPFGTYSTDRRITGDAKYGPYLGDCLGALERNTISQLTYPTQIEYLIETGKAFLSQNVLAVVTFDLRYCYILPGWEGSAHDGRVLADAVQDQGFVVPEDKYFFFLADAGYSNSDHVMIPYRGVRYHLKEQTLAGQKTRKRQRILQFTAF